MPDYATADSESIDLEPRTVRALTEKMTVCEDVRRARDADGLYLAVTQSGREYLVDTHTGACECPDAEHRQPDWGCKHVRRAALATGKRAVPAWIDYDAVDDRFGEHVTLTADSDGATAVATDGGKLLEVPGYSEHVEPPEQGAKKYVRCDACGRELLVELGGRDPLLHVDGCPNA